MPFHSPFQFLLYFMALILECEQCGHIIASQAIHSHLRNYRNRFIQLSTCKTIFCVIQRNLMRSTLVRNYFGYRKYTQRTLKNTHTYYSIQMNLIIACWEIKQTINWITFHSSRNITMCRYKDGAREQCIVNGNVSRPYVMPYTYKRFCHIIFRCELDDLEIS